MYVVPTTSGWSMRDEIKLRGRSMEEVRAYNGPSLAEKWDHRNPQGYTYRARNEVGGNL